MRPALAYTEIAARVGSAGRSSPRPLTAWGGVRQNLSKAEYNDKWGKVLEYDRAAGRYVVALSAQQNLKLKPANVRI